jgi:hypothetical protein
MSKPDGSQCFSLYESCLIHIVRRARLPLKAIGASFCRKGDAFRAKLQCDTIHLALNWFHKPDSLLLLAWVKLLIRADPRVRLNSLKVKEDRRWNSRRDHGGQSPSSDLNWRTWWRSPVSLQEEHSPRFNCFYSSRYFGWGFIVLKHLRHWLFEDR